VFAAAVLHRHRRVPISGVAIVIASNPCVPDFCENLFPRRRFAHLFYRRRRKFVKMFASTSPRKQPRRALFALTMKGARYARPFNPITAKVSRSFAPAIRP